MNIFNSKIRYLFLSILVLSVLVIVLTLQEGLSQPATPLPKAVNREYFDKKLNTNESTSSSEKKIISSNEDNDLDYEKLDLPNSINLNVPFVVQAPFADWKMPYQEACEEASLLMVAGYLNGKKAYTQEEIKKEIDNLVVYQEKLYGSHKDLNLTETGELAKNYWQLSYKIISDLDIDKIKSELSKGNPVIIPAAGRLLGNPNFRGEGPIYHMLVIKGYHNDYFITNDPGTKNGENYVYTTDKLLSAIADLVENALTGPKVGLILSK